jgi:hypothetical protein
MVQDPIRGEDHMDDDPRYTIAFLENLDFKDLKLAKED